MSNARKDRTSNGAQLDLLEGAVIIEGHMADVPLDLRAALVRAIKGCALSRYQIAAQISELMGRDLTKDMHDKYTAESADGHRLPAEIVPALCCVTGSYDPLRTLAGAMNCAVAGPDEKKEMEITRLRMEIDKLKRVLREKERGR